MTPKELIALVFVSANFICSVIGSEWTYEDSPNTGPLHWPGLCHTGRRQSPIHIQTADTTRECKKPAFKFSNGWSKLVRDYTLVNNGHTLKLSSPAFAEAKVSGGGLTSKYQLQQIHFHWSTVSSAGSEHTIDDSHYPMEMHMVMARDVEDKKNPDTSLAVFAVLFSLTANEKKVAPQMKNLAKAVEQHKELLQKDGNAVFNNQQLLANIRHLLPIQVDAFYRYKGSLTTPPCSEIVDWTIFGRRQYITQDILDTFHRIRDGENKLLVNDRPTQPLNGRKVEYYTSNC